MSHALPFSNFDEAVNRLPRFITGLDLLGQHHTIDDLRYLVQLEIDLYLDGESNTIKCPRQCDTTSRYRRAKAYIARCAAKDEQEAQK